MRVTNQMITKSAIGNISSNQSRFFKLQEKVSTGKKLRRSSDDPMMMGRVLNYQKTLSSIGQYERNIAHGESRSEIMESTLSAADELLHEAKNLAMDLARGNIDENTRASSIEIVESIYEQLMDHANTRDGSNYIFAGHQSTTQPYTKDINYNATWHGDEGDVRLIIGPQSDMSVNGGGRKVFESGGVEVFDMLRDLRTGIQNDDVAVIDTQVSLLEGAITSVADARADGSVKYQQLKVAKSNLGNLKENIQSLLSKATDVDMNQAVVELKAQETAYQASLASAASILQKSLMDFLR